MKQISQIAGVSQSTVSRILSGSDFSVPVAAETRARVLKVVADLDFTPNPLARALRGARSALLGLIVREVHDPFFAVAIDAIASEARRHGYSLVLGHAHSRADEAAVLGEALATQHCDGAILLGDLRDQPRLLARLVGRDMPLVGLCQGARGADIPVVNVDNVAGTRLALEHLYGLGHRHIAFVHGGWIGDGRVRLAAYRDFMRERGLAILPGYEQPSDNDLAGGLLAAERLLAGAHPPTAIFGASDVVALGILKGAAERGVRVPDDLSVLGFDDIPMAEYAIPSLTTVRQPIQQMARMAVDGVLEAVMGRPRTAADALIVQPDLIIRRSCARPVRAF